MLRASLMLAAAVLVSSIALFSAAGTPRFWNAWLLAGEFFVLEFTLALYLAVRRPALLRQRLSPAEKERTQKIFNVLAWTVIPVAVLVVPGLDYRFRWSNAPAWPVVAGALAMASGFAMILAVMKRNIFTARTVGVSEGQKVIDTGPYSVIRHPMYLAGMVVFLSMPAILGSLCGFVLALATVPALFVMRILNEEKVLKRDLSGYEEYMKKVRYRLVPFVW